MISVVMPAYNAEKTICQAIESVLKQTYQDFELIIINDASQDRTEREIKRFDDARIRLLKNEHNHGVAYSRNRGVREARSGRIAFLDSDDMWDRYKLEKQIALMEENAEIRLSFTGSSFMNAGGNVPDYILHVPEKITKQQILKQNLISCSSVVVEKDLMQKYPMSERRDVHEDFYSWIRILDEIGTASGIDEPLLIYRLSETSRSGNKLKSAWMNWNTYMEAGVSVPVAVISMFRYALNGIRKYKAINRAGNYEAGNRVS